MKLPSCLQKLRIPALGAVFGALALGLSASFNAPIPPAKFGVFRM